MAKATANTASDTGLDDADLFDLRWRRGARDLVGPLSRLYGKSYDVTALMTRLQALLASHWQARPAPLRKLDLERDLDPDWFLSENMVAYVFYIDKFAGKLVNLPKHIDYLRDLGVTYAHLMPCLKPRPGQSDGGYAVMDYRAINPDLGSMDDLSRVADLKVTVLDDAAFNQGSGHFNLATKSKHANFTTNCSHSAATCWDSPQTQSPLRRQ